MFLVLQAEKPIHRRQLSQSKGRPDSIRRLLLVMRVFLCFVLVQVPTRAMFLPSSSLSVSPLPLSWGLSQPLTPTPSVSPQQSSSSARSHPHLPSCPPIQKEKEKSNRSGGDNCFDWWLCRCIVDS